MLLAERSSLRLLGIGEGKTVALREGRPPFRRTKIGTVPHVLIRRFLEPTRTRKRPYLGPAQSSSGPRS
jgi:hypothetical protein